MQLDRGAIIPFLVLFLFSGCHRGETNPAQATVQTNGTSRYVKAVYGLPLTFDPAQMNDGTSLAASTLLYDGLLRFNASLEIQGALAESWTTSTDGKTLRFKLRPNTHFHDGSAITARDVVESFRRLVAPESKVYSYYDCIEGAEAFHLGKKGSAPSIFARTPAEVAIRLNSPFPPFLSVLAGATAKVLPARASKDKNFFKAPVGSGAFQWAKSEKSGTADEMIFKRFDGYYADKPKIAELVLRSVNEAQALREAREGLIHDLASYPLTGTEDIFTKGQHVKAPVANTWIIGLNARLSPFQDAKMRRRFRASLDTSNFREKFHPDAIPAPGYIPPGLPGFQWKYPKDSNQRLEDGAATTRERIRIAIPKELARHMEMKAFIETSFRAHGWNVEVVPMNWDQLMQGYSGKTLQAFLVGMNMDYPDTEFLVRNFESTNPDNFSGLKDLEIDALIRKARATQDRAERQRLYTTLVSRLAEAAVTIDLFHPRGHYWISSCVDGYDPNILAEYYTDYRLVSLKKSCRGDAG